MPSERKYFVLREDNCKFESMTKEQIISAIAQAVSTGEIADINSGIVSKIRETNKNKNIQFWLGTQAEYNAISSPDENVMYIISDDRSKEELETALEELQRAVASFDSAFDVAETKISNLSGSVASLDADTDTMQEQITALDDAIADAQADITTIQGTIETQGSSISDLIIDVAEIADFDERITGDAKTTLFTGTISPSTTSAVTLSQAVSGFSEIVVSVIDNGVISSTSYKRSIVSTNNCVFSFVSASMAERGFIFNMSGTAFNLVAFTSPNDINLTIYGIL